MYCDAQSFAFMLCTVDCCLSFGCFCHDIVGSFQLMSFDLSFGIFLLFLKVLKNIEILIDYITLFLSPNIFMVNFTFIVVSMISIFLLSTTIPPRILIPINISVQNERQKYREKSYGRRIWRPTHGL